MTITAFLTFFTQQISAQSDTLSFLHITDTHLIFDLGHYEPEFASRRKHYGNGIQPLSKLLDSVSTVSNIRFVAITGDLVDFYGATTESGEMLTSQVERFSQLITRFPIPVFLNLGNHDIASYHWNGERVLSTQLAAGKARAAWIRSAPAFAEGTYYSRMLRVGTTQYRLIFLENGYNSAGEFEKTGPPYLDRIQMEWLKTELNQSADDVEIILMHIPFGENTVGGELYEVLTKHPTIRLILAGHEHRNRVKLLGNNNRLTQVQTGAFAVNSGEWRQIKLTANTILVSSPGSKKNEITIPLKP